jgi:hypothetical protein
MLLRIVVAPEDEEAGQRTRSKDVGRNRHRAVAMTDALLRLIKTVSE